MSQDRSFWRHWAPFNFSRSASRGEAEPRASGATWRPTTPWSQPERFWLDWPQSTGQRATDDARRDDCVALAQMLSRLAPVTMVAGAAEVVECSLASPAGIQTLAAEPGGGFLADQPLWLADHHGGLAAGLAVDAGGSRSLARAAGVPVVDLPAGWRADCIETDGQGTALLLERLAADTEGGQAAAEALLAEQLGISRAIWLGDSGLGRVPARFVAPGVVVVPRGCPGDSAASAVLEENLRRLRASRDRVGRPLRVVDLPAPGQMAGCYADCMVGGDLVVVPQFGDGRDREARDMVAAAVPAARVVGFPATYLAPPGGGLGRRVVTQPRPRRRMH